MSQLKEREQKILSYMKEEIRTKGYPPTVREICAALGIKSTSTAHKDIESLVKQGYLVKDPSKPRALMVVDPVSGRQDNGAGQENGISQLRDDVIDIPVVGRVAAGTPILAEQNIEDTFPLPARYASSGTNFMLRVHGESMINAGILDGDLVLVEQSSVADNGDIVVALLDDSATVKRFYKEEGIFRLQPENDALEPIIVRDLQIMGKVIGVFRFFA